MNFYEVLRCIKEYSSSVIDLSTGAPIVLPRVTSALADAGRQVFSHHQKVEAVSRYSNLDGLPQLLETIATRSARDFGRSVSIDEVLVTPGAQAALRYILEMMRTQGRRVLYPCNLEFPGAYDTQYNIEPVAGRYVSSQLAGCNTRPRLDVASLKWQGVGAAILSRPHSPTGRLWDTSEILALASQASDHGALLVLDETYSLPFAPLTTKKFFPVDAPNIVHIYSFSKVGLAGERVAVVVGSDSVIGDIRRILRKNSIQCSVVDQYLAISLIELFKEVPDIAAEFGYAYERRWNIVSSTLEASGVLNEGVSISEWEGGPFLWLEWEGPPTSESVFLALLKAGVAVAPRSSITAVQGMADEDQYAGIRIGLGESEHVLGKAAKLVALGLAHAKSLRRP